ncbi:MAG: Integral membrane protein MviN [Parcubacteria group bacterium Gr01-1014_38]|nr:MAG: Integral membrane protein MviN [Parcubacteria group bacterium Gr01-1014_38]
MNRGYDSPVNGAHASPPTALPRLLRFDVSERSLTTRTVHALTQYGALGTLGLLTLPLFSRLLGSAGVGRMFLYLTMRSFVRHLCLVNVREGTLPLLPHLTDRAAIRAQYLASLTTGLLSAAVWSLVVATLGPWILPAVLRDASPALSLLLFSTAVADLGIMLPQAFQRTRILALANTAVEVGGVTLALALVFAGRGPEAIIWGLSASALLTGIVLHALALRAVGGFARPQPALARHAIHFGVRLLPITFLPKFLDGIGRITAAVLLDERAVGILATAYLVASPLLATLTVLGFVWLPTAKYLLVHDRDRFARLLATAPRVLGSVLGIGIILITAIAPAVIPAVSTPDFAAAATAVPLIAAGLASFVFAALLQGLFLAMGTVRPVLQSALLSLLASATLAFPLTRSAGMLGAAAAGTIGYAVHVGVLLFRWQQLGAVPLPWAQLRLIAGLSTLFVLVAVGAGRHLSAAASAAGGVLLAGGLVFLLGLFGVFSWRELRRFTLLLMKAGARAWAPRDPL